MNARFVPHILAILAALCAVMIGILYFSGMAHAQSRCGPRSEIIKVLSDKYKEFLHGTGTINDQVMMEIFISHTGTWTIIITDTNGTTCILAAGDAWDDLPNPPGGQGT